MARWIKGQSGNPKGRPRSGTTTTGLARSQVEKDERVERPQRDAIAMQESPAEGDAIVERFFRDATGVKTDWLAQRLVGQAAALEVLEFYDSESKRIMAAASLLRGLEPANATEALLAIQMIGVHNAALLFLGSATAEGQTVELRDANVLRAMRLLRVFNEQLQAMSKLKGKTGQQKVRVEHVHVHEGGQAIVGAVSTTKRGKEESES